MHCHSLRCLLTSVSSLYIIANASHVQTAIWFWFYIVLPQIMQGGCVTRRPVKRLLSHFHSPCSSLFALKLVFGTILKFCIFLGVYIGNLIAYMVIKDYKPPFNTLEEMAEQSEYAYGTEKGIFIEQLFTVRWCLLLREYQWKSSYWWIYPPKYVQTLCFYTPKIILFFTMI